jgi:hypothetical protein
MQAAFRTAFASASANSRPAEPAIPQRLLPAGTIRKAKARGREGPQASERLRKGRERLSKLRFSLFGHADA